MSARWEVRQGDAVEQLREFADGSVDAIVCDPPYGLEFMGKDWDRLSGQPGYVERGRITDRPDAQVPYGRGGGVNSYQAGRPMQAWHEAWAREALRVLKPGGHLLAFGGTRTYHRLACAVEDAGFEIRDSIMWLYGSGFPKSLDVAKAIDKAANAVREVVGVNPNYRDPGVNAEHHERWNAASMSPAVTVPATAEAQVWDGWGTALKPAHEPIVMARKPLAGTVAANVLEHGTGALNIAATRIPVGDRASYERNHSGDRGHDGTRSIEDRGVTDLRLGGGSAAAERWPANVVLDEEAAADLDRQTGELASGGYPVERSPNAVYGTGSGGSDGPRRMDLGGGASRFFYCAKASSTERNAGLREGLPRTRNRRKRVQQDAADLWWPRVANRHPTVKPIELMRWLVRLVTPPGGLVVDPFVGSGTTGCATVLEGFRFVGVERDPEYVAIARARIEFWRVHPNGLPVEVALEADAARRRVREEGQLGLDFSAQS